MRIIVDVDDVVADLLGRWLELYNQDFNDNLRPSDIKLWDLVEFVKPECGARIYDYLDRPDLYDQVEPIPGSLEGVSLLRSRGHQLLFVSAVNHPAKFGWLCRNGFLERTDTTGYIVASDKSLIRADLIIDDNVETVRRFPGKSILVSRHHNQFAKNVVRADDWYGIFRLVEKFEAEEARSVVPGLGKDAPIHVNAHGGKQSKLNYRFDLIDPLTMFTMANILHDGAETYGTWNWRRISVEENLNHALSHIFAHLAGDQQDDHLGHAFCRVMFALSVHLTPGESDRMVPGK
jgi:5'-nucleotidase